MYLGLDLRGGVHFLLQVDMKAALDKAADRYTTDIRSLLREEKMQYAGVAREGANVVDALPRRRRAHQGARRDREDATPISRCARPTPAAASSGSSRASSPRRRSASRTAPSQQNITDPAQPRQRARRRRADHPAAGRRPRRRAAAGRAGHRARQGHPRPHRDARDPHGQRRAGRARSGARRQRAARQRPLHRAQRRAARWCGGRSC